VNIPNLLTFARILMIPLCLWFLDQDTPRAGFWSAIVFTLAAITDILDGYLARKLGVVSVLGKLIDPLADKLIVMATLVWLVPMGRMPAWAVIVLLAREFSVTALRSVAASEGVIISAGAEGKTKTAIQMIAIGAMILDPLAWRWLPEGAATTYSLVAYVGLWVAAALTVGTGYAYFRAGLRHLHPRAARARQKRAELHSRRHAGEAV